MDHKIAEQLRFQEQQAKVHADCAAGASAAPARALHTDVHFLKRRFCDERERSQARFKLLSRNAGQPAPLGIHAMLLTAGITGQVQDAVSESEMDCFCVSDRPITNDNLPVDCR